jgi:hypothetical protein
MFFLSGSFFHIDLLSNNHNGLLLLLLLRLLHCSVRRLLPTIHINDVIIW